MTTATESRSDCGTVPEELTVDIAGISDVCGVCGRSITHFRKLGLVGVNALLCRRCREQSSRLGLWWIAVHSQHVFDVWVLLTFPESPYSGSTASPVFLDQVPELDAKGYPAESDSLTFEGLTTSEQAVVCWLSCGDIPPDYMDISHDTIVDTLLQTVDPRLTYKTRDDQPSRGQLLSQLPELFCIDQGNVYVPAAGEQMVRSMLSTAGAASKQQTLFYTDRHE